jgi:hypothetical protein
VKVGISVKRGSFATAMIRTRSSAVSACDGVVRIASGRRSPRVRPSYLRLCDLLDQGHAIRAATSLT